MRSPRKNPPFTEWIASHAIPHSTVEGRHGFADLQPLKKVIGNARIVELGEATHGTREFFQLKHRMLEFLTTEMGFTIFSIEANMPKAHKVNDYVLRGEGDPAKLLKGSQIGGAQPCARCVIGPLRNQNLAKERKKAA